MEGSYPLVIVTPPRRLCLIYSCVLSPPPDIVLVKLNIEIPENPTSYLLPGEQEALVLWTPLTQITLHSILLSLFHTFTLFFSHSVESSGLGWAGLLLQGDGLLAPAAWRDASALSSSACNNRIIKTKLKQQKNHPILQSGIQHYLFCSWSWLPTLFLLE